MKVKSLQFLHSIKFLSNSKFGYRDKLSTEHNLQHFLVNIYDNLNDNKFICVFLDIKKNCLFPYSRSFNFIEQVVYFRNSKSSL